MTQPIPFPDTTHHQQWQFSRFSYLSQPRPNHGFLLVLSGSMDYVNQNDTLHLGPDDLVYLPEGSRYEVRFHPGTEDLLINFRFLDTRPEALPSEPRLVMRDSLHTLQPLMEQTVSLFHTNDRYYEALSMFYRFWGQLTLALQAERSDRTLIQRAKALLSQPNCPDLTEVARQLLISPSSLRKKFKDAEGIPPARYRLLQRVDNARQLLLSTDLPLNAIAERCGFCDEAYFHKCFSQVLGTTPTVFRTSRPMHY